MGYETHNSLMNLGSVSLFIVLYFVILVFLLFFKIIVWKTGYGTSYYNSIKKRLIFGIMISLFMEPFMELLISAYLNLIAPVSTKNGDMIGIFMAYISAASACGILPFSYLWVVTRN